MNENLAVNGVLTDKYTGTWVSTPLGRVWLMASSNALSGLWFEGQRHFPEDWAARLAACPAPHHPLLEQVQDELGDYFAGRRQRFDVPVAWPWGSAFQHTVWQHLTSLSFGQTQTYGAVALALGHTTAFARAIGSAVGRNPIGIIIPCHRILGANGSLTGYAGGLERKRQLLALEFQGHT
jgi:methylated-DNA-[protein]-cysteine S-methyltransferase